MRCIIFFAYMFIGLNCTPNIYNKDKEVMPDEKLLAGVYVNSFAPTLDTLIFHKGFTLITKDSLGNRVTFHSIHYGYGIPNSDFMDGTGELVMKPEEDTKTLRSVVHFESSKSCENLLVIDTLYQFIWIPSKEGKSRSQEIIKRNTEGLPYRFVKCLP